MIGRRASDEWNPSSAIRTAEDWHIVTHRRPPVLTRVTLLAAGVRVSDSTVVRTGEQGTIVNLSHLGSSDIGVLVRWDCDPDPEGAIRMNLDEIALAGVPEESATAAALRLMDEQAHPGKIQAVRAVPVLAQTGDCVPERPPSTVPSASEVATRSPLVAAMAALDRREVPEDGTDATDLMRDGYDLARRVVRDVLHEWEISSR